MGKKYGNYQDKKDQVWEKGKKIRGKDPNLYRRDEQGNEMYKPSYGKATEKGWEIGSFQTSKSRWHGSPQ